MSRTPLPLVASDISAFAKSLRGQLAGLTAAPSHVELLNMLARSTGYRNFQHFRAQAVACGRLDEQASGDGWEPVDYRRVERVAGHFDQNAVLLRWPARRSHQELCLWELWSRFEAGRSYGEKAVNAVLEARHGFGDHALLRRELCDAGLLSRTRDGRDYRRVEVRPSAEGAALIRHLAGRGGL
jgi:hypothetical protein